MHIAKKMVNSTTVTTAYLASVLDSQMLPTNKIKEPPIFLSKNKFRTSKLLSTLDVCLFSLLCTKPLIVFYKKIMKRVKFFDFTVANKVHL